MTRVAPVAFRTLACLVCVAALGSSSPLFAQRSDRATISGVVSDAQGSPVPGATVTIKNEETGVETAHTTNEAGAYNSPPLVLGRYTVTVDLSGFKKSVTSGILLQGGDAFRIDVTLEVGALTESVEVIGASGLSETRPDVSHTVNEKYYHDLPIVSGADVRLAESVLQMQPGYLPMKPNGDPMFRGSQFNSRINGGQTMATENFFDGAAFGYAVGHQQSHESTMPVEAVKEVKVITTTYSAQYGHTSGGFIEYTSKSGTNSFRGSALRVFRRRRVPEATASSRNSGLDKTPLRNDNFGFTLGGPVVLPKLQRPRQDVLLHQHRLHADPLRHAVRASATRRRSTRSRRRLQRAADGQADRRRRAGAADLRGPDLQSRDHAARSTACRCAIRIPATIIPANDPLRSVVASQDRRR